MAFCPPCSRPFVSEESLQQHIAYSPVHNTPPTVDTPTFICEICTEAFDNQMMLIEHLKNSPLNATSPTHLLYSRTYIFRETLEQRLQDTEASASTLNCDPCARTFKDQSALDQHLQNAPAHSFKCEPCARSFKKQSALDQHLQDAPAHSASFKCEPCARSFKDQNALDQHLQYSPAHSTTTFNCELCSRSFKSQSALDEHMQDSKSHVETPATPLDLFFNGFPSFRYDRTLSPATSFQKLIDFHGWDRDDSKYHQARRAYNKALTEELRLWFGSEKNLDSWHSLCRAVGINPLPKDCKAAKKVCACMVLSNCDVD
ncbi:hypothetical protein N7466_002948 [Penicillium verhagenii]|uniref:uncharacterized protein n=1 Tax=Penicillium verhagenii TaxID=1562060 RepID=UPI002545A3CE|nr:uncharacterized protein N7466_002948 [Penicillium verhagenii]KAJ5939814.1 hypothetical protein N7466_002948 [Penicillium verhagenii]